MFELRLFECLSCKKPTANYTTGFLRDFSKSDSNTQMLRHLRKAFTLIELLVIIAIMAAMTTASILSIRAGQGAARIKGSSRDIFATIRQARSIALVTQQPAIITYSEYDADGEKCAKIEINATKMMSSTGVARAETLSGETVELGGGGEESPEGGEGAQGGQTIEEILFSPMAEEVVKGVRIRVTKGDELLEIDRREEKAAAKISVFSNVDYLLGRFEEAKKKASEEKEKEEKSDSVVNTSAVAASADLQSPVSIVWEVNGRCEPHKVWVYPDGEDADKGLCINVDRFGAAKIMSGGEM